LSAIIDEKINGYAVNLFRSSDVFTSLGSLSCSFVFSILQGNEGTYFFMSLYHNNIKKQAVVKERDNKNGST